jgi:AraC family transcriptional regulator of adaptative response/methylated-DNA-[protein]-cysteine methyltransferase
VRADGGLSGYRWGIERKRALLDREAQAADDRQARTGTAISRGIRRSV